MGQKKNVSSPDSVIREYNVEIPEEMKAMEHPLEVAKSMLGWTDGNRDKRAYVLVVNSECEDSEAGAACVAMGGNLSVIVGSMVEAYGNDPKFRKVMQTLVPELCDEYGTEFLMQEIKKEQKIMENQNKDAAANVAANIAEERKHPIFEECEVMVAGKPAREHMLSMNGMYISGITDEQLKEMHEKLGKMLSGK